MSELAGLWVTLELQSGVFMRDMELAEKKFEHTKELAELCSDTFKDVGKVMAGTGTVILGAVTAATLSFAHASDELSEMSQRTGMSTQTLQELSYVAKLTGTDMANLEVGFKRMQAVITDASNGVGAANTTLHELGVKIKDIVNLSPDEQFNRLSAALAGIEDPTKRASLAVDLFGRSGTAILPALADGAAGFRKMRDEASQFGTVAGKDTVKAAGDLYDNIDRLKMGFTALWNEVAISVLPSVTAFIEKVKGTYLEIRNWIKDNRDLFNLLVQFSTTVAGDAVVVGTLALAFGKVVGTVAELQPKIAALWMTLQAHPFVALTVAIEACTLALLNLAIARKDEENANINTGKTHQQLIQMHRDEIKAIDDKIAKLKESDTYSYANHAKIADMEVALEQRKQLLLKAIAAQEVLDEQQKNAAKETGLVTHHQNMLTLTQQFMADKTIQRQADIDTEELMQQEMYANLGSSFVLFIDDYEKKTINWYDQLHDLASSYQQSLQVGFATAFNNIGSGWEGLCKGMAAFGEALKQAIINQIACIAAEWVTKHTIMIAATKAWAAVEIAWNAAVAAAKAVAASAWALWGAVAIGAGIMAAVMGFMPKFADGGIVSGNSYAGDNVMAAVNSGEMILNRRQQARLFDIANGDGGRGSGEQTIIFELDGRTVAQVAVENFPAILRLNGATN